MSWRAARWRRTARERAAMRSVLLRDQAWAEVLADLRAEQQSETLRRRAARSAEREAEPAPDLFPPR